MSGLWRLLSDWSRQWTINIGSSHTPEGRRPKDRRWLGSLPWFPIIILAGAGVAAAIGPWLAPHSPTIGNLALGLTPPWGLDGGSPSHLLGTDFLGRDVFSRVLHGARVSVLVGALGTLTAIVIGGTLGVLAGYVGGVADHVVMRAVDISLSIPTVLLGMIMAVLLGAGTGNVILVTTLVFWGRFARQLRGEVLSIKEREFVTYAYVMGATPPRIIIRHIVPNLVDTIIVIASLTLGQVILLEATLSFLGVGVPPPTPSWGRMINEGREFLVEGWWISTFPGLSMALLVLATNLLGDWLRDHLDPRLRGL